MNYSTLNQEALTKMTGAELAAIHNEVAAVLGDDQYKNRARVLVTRRRLKSLLQFAEELRGLMRSAYGTGFSYNQNDNVFRLPNGATVALTHCESSAALQDTVQGMTFSLIVVDEAGEGPELPVIDSLALTLRAPGVPLRMILAGNPGGANHSALAERYVTGRDPKNISRGTGRTPGQIAPALHAVCARSGVRARGVIDSAAEARTAGRAESSIGDLFREAGVRVTPARKGARVPRFELLKQLMANGEFFVASRCRYWLATVPALPRDPRNPEDVDSSANDHALDATSYLIAGASAGQVSMGDFAGRPPRLPDTGNRVCYI